MPTITDTIHETSPAAISRRAALVAAYLARQTVTVPAVDRTPAITARLSMILVRPAISPR